MFFNRVQMYKKNKPHKKRLPNLKQPFVIARIVQRFLHAVI